MKLLVVGTVAYDTVKTPFGNREATLGGSAAYASVAASHLTRVGISAAVGEDFKEEDRALLSGRGIDLTAMETVAGAKSFHWQGEYEGDMNEARTLRTDLNVLTLFDPVLPPAHRAVPFVFLANVAPSIQLKVLDQLEAPKLVAADTMNYWIDSARPELLEVLKRIDVLLINEGEARQLTGESNLPLAGRRILSLGPSTVILKRGEHGVLQMGGGDAFALPAFPLERVVDPTGAGDSFAGGFMGTLSATGSLDRGAIRRAVVMGSVMASHNVEDFSMHRLAGLERAAIEARYVAFKRLTEFEDLG